jgi:hypothetical protein
MLTKEQTHSHQKALGRGFQRLAYPLAFALVIFGCAFSTPAVACLCSCSVFSSRGADTAGAAVTPTEYEQIFSGLIISTERIDEPVVAATAASGGNVVEAPGYWIRSRILVLRSWRGAPSTVAEVWTPVGSDCDSPPIVGSYFVALVRSEKGRSVASNSPCDCAQKAAATEGRGAFTVAGIVIIAAAICAAAIASLSLAKVIR